MIKINTSETKIEVTLPPIVTKLELISPFVFTKISLSDEGTIVDFELMSLEWLGELCSFLNQDLYPPAEYRTNLTPGGEEFYANLITSSSLGLKFYDKLSRSWISVKFTGSELMMFVELIYDQLVNEFQRCSSSKKPIEEHRAGTLGAVKAWQQRMARKAS